MGIKEFADGARNVWKAISVFPDPEDLYGGRKEYFDSIRQRTEYRLGEQDRQLKVKFGKPDDNVRSNLIGKVVNQSVYLLLSKGVLFDLPGDDSKEQKWLDACWEANQKDIILKKMAINSADAGTGYVKLVPDGVLGTLEGKEELFPRIVNLDPKHMEMITHPEDFEQVITYIIEYDTKDLEGKPMKRREETTHIGEQRDATGKVVDEGGYWEVTNYVKPYNENWQQMGAPVKWENDFPPIIHWQNLPAPNTVYGEPEASDSLLELQDRRNFNASNINKIIRFHAHPKTYTVNLAIPKRKDGGSSMDTDQITQFVGENGKVANLEMQSDLAAAIQFYDLLGKQIFDQTSTVDVSNLKDKLGQLTNFSVRVLFQEALWKMDMKRELFGHMLRQLNRRLLIIGDQKNTDVGVIIWPDVVLPTDESERIVVQEFEMNKGLVSPQTVSVERNRDFKLEQERIKKAKGSLETIENESNQTEGQSKGQEG